MDKEKMTIRRAIRIEKLTIDHVNEILQTNREAQNFTGEQIKQAVEHYQNNGDCYALIVDEIPVMCAGIVDQKFGNGEAWVFMSDLFFTKYKFVCHRVLKKALPVVARDMELKRVQALIDEDTNTELNQKWIKSFGFEPEGISRNYGMNGETYYRYARIF